MHPVLSWEVIEGKQRIFVLGETVNCLLVLGLVLGDKGFSRGLSVVSRGRPPDLVDVVFDLCALGSRQVVQDIGGLMEPAALMLGRGVDLAKGSPEPEGTISDGEQGCVHSPCLQIYEHLPPGLGRLTGPVL